MTTPPDAEQLIEAWAQRRIADIHDDSRLPDGPDPVTCQHAWFVAEGGILSSHFCFRGCGASKPAGVLLTDEEQARARAYDSTYERAYKRYVELLDGQPTT